MGNRINKPYIGVVRVFVLILINVFVYASYSYAQSEGIPSQIVSKMIELYRDSLEEEKEEVIKGRMISLNYDFNGDGDLDWFVYFERIHCGSGGCHGPLYLYDKKNKSYCFAGHSYPEMVYDKKVDTNLECREEY